MPRVDAERSGAKRSPPKGIAAKPLVTNIGKMISSVAYQKPKGFSETQIEIATGVKKMINFIT